MAEARKLGDLLKEAGLIDDFQLQSALSHQRNWGGKLGSILVELEFVNEEELGRVISEKLRIPHADLFEPEIPEDVIKLIKIDVAKKYRVVPVKKEKNALVVAMSDPLDIQAMDELRFITGLNIKPSLALESEIRDAIKKYYDGEEIVRKQKPLYPQAHSAGGKMEFIPGSDLCMPKTAGRDANSSILSKDESVQQALQDSKLRIDALIAILIEKELITREDLVSMIYQKKLGM